MIHEKAIIDGDVEMDSSVSIGPYAHIIGPATIGRNVRIGSHCCIGGEPEHRASSRNGRVEIGADCDVREHVTIHAPTGGVTSIGNRVMIMNHSYVGHDSRLEDDVSLYPNVFVGGFAVIQRGAYLGMGTSIHQWTIVGPYAMTAMNSAVQKHVPPLFTVGGVPAKFLKVNRRGLDRVEQPLDELWGHYSIAKAYRIDNRDQIAWQNPKGHDKVLSEHQLWLNFVSRSASSR